MSLPQAMKAITLPLSPVFTVSNPSKGADLVLNPTQPIPVPTANELLILVHAVALTPYELTWDIYSLPRPHIPCQDIAGTVISAPVSSGFAPGDKVFGLIGFETQGGLAEYVVAHPKYFSIISEGVGFVEAASLPRAVLTAWQAVRVQKGGLLRKGMRVLVTGATGAVGRMAIQVLRGVVGEGGRVIAVGGVGSEGLKGLGADVVVNYREVSDWEDVVRREGKVDVVLDIVGGKTLERCLSLVKDGGQVIALGSPEPVWENVKGWKEAQQRGVKGLFFIVEGNGEQLKEITALVQEGAIKPSVSVVVDGLTEGGVRDGWTKAERGGLAGSVVVKVV